MYAGARAKGFSAADKSGAVFDGPYDGIARFEIDDSASRLKVDGMKRLMDGQKCTVSDVLDHPELFKEYPAIAKMPVESYLSGDEYASYVRRQGKVLLGAEAIKKASGSDAESAAHDKEFRGIFLHELQHTIQHIEGFDQGSSPGSFYKQMSDEQYKSRGMHKSESLPEDIVQKMSKQAYQKYMNTSGEIEARDVSARLDLSKEERARNMPFSSYAVKPEDVHRSDQKDDLETSIVTTKLRAQQMMGSLASATESFSFMKKLFSDDEPKAPGLKARI